MVPRPRALTLRSEDPRVLYFIVRRNSSTSHREYRLMERHREKIMMPVMTIRGKLMTGKLKAVIFPRDSLKVLLPGSPSSTAWAKRKFRREERRKLRDNRWEKEMSFFPKEARVSIGRKGPVDFFQVENFPQEEFHQGITGAV